MNDCKSLKPCSRHVRLLEFIYISRLQVILGLRWMKKVTRKFDHEITSIESMLLHRHLHRQCHVIRMPEIRLPHCVFYGQLRHCHIGVDGQKKRHKDHINTILITCNIRLNRHELFHPTHLSGDFTVPLKYHILCCSSQRQSLNPSCHSSTPSFRFFSPE